MPFPCGLSGLCVSLQASHPCSWSLWRGPDPSTGVGNAVPTQALSPCPQVSRALSGFLPGRLGGLVTRTGGHFCSL